MFADFESREGFFAYHHFSKQSGQSSPASLYWRSSSTDIMDKPQPDKDSSSSSDPNKDKQAQKPPSPPPLPAPTPPVVMPEKQPATSWYCPDRHGPMSWVSLMLVRMSSSTEADADQ